MVEELAIFPRNMRCLFFTTFLLATVCVSFGNAINTTKHPATRSCVLPQPLASRVQAKPSADSFAEAGEWFEAKRDFRCAAEEYRAAVKLEKTSVELLLRLAGSEVEAGNAKSAEETLRQAIQVAPQNKNVHIAYARALERLQNKDAAKQEWDAALAIDKKSVNALDGMAQHLIAESNYAGAVQLLQGAPENEALSVDLVQAYGKAGLLEQAATKAKDALQKMPQSFPLTYSLATLLIDLGRMGEAKDVGEKFAQTHPENLDAQRMWLHLLIRTNDVERARPMAKRLLAQSPRDAYFLGVNGMLERDAGDFTAARTHLRESIDIEPANADTHYYLGLVLAKLNEPREARAELERAITLGGKQPEIRFQLSKVLESLGDKDAAAKQMAMYRAWTEEQSKRSVTEAKAEQAQKEYEGGNAEKAVSLYKEALEMTPDDALLNFKLAMALDKAGDAAGEKAALEKSVGIDADMAIAHNQLGYLASRQGDLMTAEAQFREAVRAAPSYAEAWINLAATLAGEEKMQEAKQAVVRALQADPNNVNALQLQKDLEVAPRQ
jgi:tetratricopeptide (TPR) repeat protein